jgi:hypothetical protein
MIRKKYPENVDICSITQGYLVSKNVYRKLLISPELPHIYSVDSKFLVIYAIYPKLSRITCYPLKYDHCFKISIVSNTSKSTILEDVSSILEGKVIIHSTGLKEKDQQFVVELYLCSRKNWEEACSLIDNFRNISEIQHAMVELIEFEI